MYFVILGTDKPDMVQQRRDAISAVVSYVQDQSSHPDVAVHCAGPTLDEEGNMNGTFNLIEAPSHDAARDYLANYPLQKMGLLEDVIVRHLDWKTGCPE